MRPWLSLTSATMPVQDPAAVGVPDRVRAAASQERPVGRPPWSEYT